MAVVATDCPCSIDEFLAHFRNVKAKGDKQWLASCSCTEAHNNGDTTPSLSISVGRDGRRLVKCQSQQCDHKAIVEAAGLRYPIDLFQTALNFGNGKAQRKKPSPDDVVKRFAFVDANGRHLMDEVRHEDRHTGKRTKSWSDWKVPEAERPKIMPLYRLPDLVRADPSYPVFVVEGPHKADLLWQFGLTATTSAWGAGNAHKTDWTLLQRFESVAIVPDNDTAGRGYRDSVATVLDATTIIKVVELPGLPEGDDIADYYKSREWPECFDIGDHLIELAHKAPRWEPTATATEPEPDGKGDKPASRLSVVHASDTEPQLIKWLWPDRFPLGKLSLIVGLPSTGKGFLASDMIGRITTGRPWPDQDHNGSQPIGDVFVIQCEDGIGDTLVPRLISHNADRSRVHFVEGVFRPKEAEASSFVIERDAHILERELEGYPDTRLVLIDPIDAFLGGDVDSHRNADVRRCLAPLARMAEHRGVAIVGILHLNKATSMPALHRVSGSGAYVAAARACWLVARDTEGPTQRLFLRVKANLTRDVGGLSYVISAGPDANGAAQVQWSTKEVLTEADDVLSPDRSKPGEPKAQAVAFLQDFLADGPKPVAEILEAAEAHGISTSKGGTLYRAKDDAGVKPEKVGLQGGWVWRLQDNVGE